MVLLAVRKRFLVMLSPDMRQSLRSEACSAKSCAGLACHQIYQSLAILGIAKIRMDISYVNFDVR